MSGLDPVARARLLASDDRIVVTGASGWLGMATLDLLRQALGPAFDTRVVAFGSSERLLPLRSGAVRQRALANLASLPPVPTRVLHYAFPTKDRAVVTDAADYASACAELRATMLAGLDTIGARGVFVASSGAAALADDPAASPAMRRYGAEKRRDEAAFANLPGRVVIARIFNLAGPYINKPDAYALASFIRDARRGRPIAVNAPRAVVRGYVVVRELVSLALTLTLAGEGVTRFATGGTAMELAEVARLVGAVLGGAVCRAPIVDPHEDRYVGDEFGYARLLAEHDIAPVSLAAAIRETAAALPPTLELAA